MNLLWFPVYSQHENFVVPDSISSNSLKELSDKFYSNFELHPDKANIYANTYYKKAIVLSDTTNIVWGYYHFAVLNRDDPKSLLLYLDKCIELSKNLKSDKFPELFYINKGYYYSEEGQYQEALNNYFKGLDFTESKNNKSYKYIILHNIAILKRKLGNYDEAINLLQDCLKYEVKKENKKKSDSISYLETLSELITTYRYNNQIDSVKYYNKVGLNLSKSYEILDIFNLNEAYENHRIGKYEASVDSIEKITDRFFTKSNKIYFSNQNVVEAFNYQAQNYIKLEKPKKVEQQFKILDSLIQNSENYTALSRTSYANIVDYYRQLGDQKNQLKFINRLLKVDSILDADFKLISNKLTDEFDLKNLEKEKDQLIRSIEKKEFEFKLLISLSIIFLSVFILFIGIEIKKRRKDKLKFEKLLNEKKIEKKKIELSEKQAKSFDISKKVVSRIVEQLSKFEKNKDFLQTDLTTLSLATQFETNSKYLSKIIRKVHEKNFNQYINDLRIEYAIDKIKTDKEFRNYKIQYISQHLGYKNVQSFTTYFSKKTGLKPSYFINRINTNYLKKRTLN